MIQEAEVTLEMGLTRGEISEREGVDHLIEMHVKVISMETEHEVHMIEIGVLGENEKEMLHHTGNE